MSISIDWGSLPITVKSEEKEELNNFLKFLKNKGIQKHSIIMNDRKEKGFLFFIYSKFNKETYNKWKYEG
ncbi:MAG: hypothetical protein CMB64_05955 [Euryarchaeota archaeon]|nr:hypothetical protein [Euryarchaeota archaeon]|tara:strand:- start:624 stop:833 length:210 start_codon:yes stop_codon:yes gene_type:complete